ncbi:MAG: hypothetical protein IJN50_06160 [Clostridia bacterium]|nr:hypothetical protein [Clostridia bacterium]
MENASKALLIAGAILIVILLIAVGMLVYSQSRSVIDVGVAQMSSTEISMFNAQFNDYSGSQKGSSVKALLQAVNANNQTYKDDQSKIVEVTTSGSGVGTALTNSKDANAISNTISSIQSSKKYTVTFTTDSSNGLITSVKISG